MSDVGTQGAVNEIIEQRNNALNRAAQLAGELAEARSKIAEMASETDQE